MPSNLLDNSFAAVWIWPSNCALDEMISNTTEVLFDGVPASFDIGTFSSYHCIPYSYWGIILFVNPPSHPAGFVYVTVITKEGVLTTSDRWRFLYVAPPTVTSVSPASGPLAGGNTVTITGSNFTSMNGGYAVQRVSFGTTTASFKQNSDTSVTAVVPPGSPGTVDVMVFTLGGGSVISPADQYTYVPFPIVTKVSPVFGSPAGGNTVIITGTGLTGATSVMFGTTPASSFNIVSTE